MQEKGKKKKGKERASLGRLGKREKKENRGKKERKWRYNWSLDGGAEMVVKGGKKNGGEN